MAQGSSALLYATVLNNVEGVDGLLKEALGEIKCCKAGLAYSVCSDCDLRLADIFSEVFKENTTVKDYVELVTKAMFIATYNGYYTIMKLLLPYCDIDQKFNSSDKGILKYRDFMGLNPVQVCVARGDLEGFTLLLKAGANLHILDENDCSLLHLATQYMKFCSLNNQFSIISLLLEAGLSPNLRNKDGNSALQHYIKSNYDIKCSSALVPYLSKGGCNVDMLNTHSHSALHLAVIRVDSEMVSLLLMKGASVHVGEEYFASPVDVAREYAIASYTSHKEYDVFFNLMMMLMSAGGMPSSCIHLNSSQSSDNYVRIKTLICNKQFLRTLLLVQNKSVLIMLKELCYPFTEEYKFVHVLYREEKINAMSEDELRNILNEPSTLEELTAMVIRRNLYPNAWVSVGKLNLPKSVQLKVTDPEVHLKRLTALKTKVLHAWSYEFTMSVLDRRLSHEQS